MVTDEEVERAVNYYRDAAEKIADARARVKFLDHKRKVIRSTLFLEASGGVAEREAIAETRQEYKDVLDEYRSAVYDAEFLGTRLKAAELKIETWRTQQASNRRGHV